MKKQFVMKGLALIATVITMYVLLFWEPKINENNESKSTSENISNKVGELTSKNEEILSEIDKDSSEVIYDNVDDTSEEDKILVEEAVITVDINAVLEQLNIEDRLKVNEILKKLSVVDYSKFINELNSSDENSGAIKAFKLLKRRVSIEDYNIIRELLQQYVDFTSIDI